MRIIASLASLILIGLATPLAQDTPAPPGIDQAEAPLQGKPTVASEPRILTGTELVSAAMSLQADIEELGAEALDQWFDTRTFIRRINEGRAIGALMMMELRRALDAAAVFDFLITDLENDATLVFRNVTKLNGEPRARFRLVDSEGAFNYLDLLLIAAPDGAYRLADLAPLGLGGDLSRHLGLVAESMARAGTGMETDVGAFFTAAERGDYRQAWELFPHEHLDEDNRLVLMLVRLHVAFEVGDEEYVQAYSELREAFPDHPGLYLFHIDAAWLQERYHQALEAVDRLEELVGPDAVLDMTRAALYSELEDLPRARELARRAVEAEPELLPAVAVEFELSLQAADYERAIALMEHLEHVFGHEFDPLEIEATPDLAPLILTEAYRQWRAERDP